MPCSAPSAYLFDHADIYGDGMSESIFGEAFADDSSIKREDIYLQSKCGIRQGFYDLSKEHILKSVDGILQRLHTDYLDLLLLHRPDTLVEPEDVAAAFDVLYESGKVRHFGVSNHKPMHLPADANHAAVRETAGERNRRMEWWRDAKFGMFIHYGLYSGLAGE